MGYKMDNMRLPRFARNDVSCSVRHSEPRISLRHSEPRRGVGISLIITVIAGLTCNLLTSCTAGFLEMNTNPNQVTGEQMEVNNYRTGTTVLHAQRR